jgi:hypothetical protein
MAIGDSTLLLYAMALPSNVARRLREVLGKEAAEDLVTWMDETSTVRADLAELRHEMQAGFARMEARFEQLQVDLTGRIELARSEAKSDIERLRAETSAQIERSRADLIKCSFVFWVGAVTAIAALAGVLGG